jgi:hypothetical protein
MENCLRVLLIRAGKTFVEKEYAAVEDILTDIGVSNQSMEMFETYECGIEGVGIIAREQNNDGLKPNRLGINGDFVMIGMNRIYEGHEEPYPHIFSSLEGELMAHVRMSVIKTTYKNATKGWSNSELEGE